jgi:hypothetical protein
MMVLKQIQVLLVDMSIGQFCAKGNIFQSCRLILRILLLKQYTFSVFDFCKLFFKSEKCQTSGVGSHLTLAIQGYDWFWLVML